MSKPALLRRRLPRYAVGIATALSGTKAAGAIVVFDDSHAFAVNHSNPHALWNIDGDLVADFSLNYSANPLPVLTAFAPVSTISNRFVHKYSHANPAAVGSGLAIGAVMPGYSFNPGGLDIFVNQGMPTPDLHFGTQNVGFRLFISGSDHYGWANITLVTNGILINNWAYESIAGASIMAGVVPEPANSAVGLGLLALGAAGVSAYKRKKKLAAA